MADYRIGCGAFGIYAGVLNKKGDKWLHKSDVTDECINASAQFLLENDQCLKFEYKGKKYVMRIDERKESDNGWIPTAERLPTEDGLYRVTIHPDYLTPICIRLMMRIGLTENGSTLILLNINIEVRRLSCMNTMRKSLPGNRLKIHT